MKPHRRALLKGMMAGSAIAAVGLPKISFAKSATPTAREVVLVTVPWTLGLTVGQAVQASGLPARYPDADVNTAALGRWGRTVRLDEPARPGDRIEVYRPLKVDPKEARRQRYRAQGPKRKPPQPRRPRPPFTAPDTPR